MELVRRVVVLAAGRGSRLVAGGEVPKPLVPIGGEPLLVRSLKTFARAGVREAIVVVGFRGAEIRRALRARRDIGLDVEIAVNPAWQRSNGLSVLAAAPWLAEPSLLTMADHLLSEDMIARLSEPAPVDGGLVLGVDRDIDGCFDLDDATKVRSAAGRIVAIGKQLTRYDCLDTGLFQIAPTLVDSLRAVVEREGDASLSAGVQELSRRGLGFVREVESASWLDVDTPEAWTEAARRLIARGDASGEVEMPRYVRGSVAPPSLASNDSQHFARMPVGGE